MKKNLSTDRMFFFTNTTFVWLRHEDRFVYSLFYFFTRFFFHITRFRRVKTLPTLFLQKDCSFIHFESLKMNDTGLYSISSCARLTNIVDRWPFRWRHRIASWQTGCEIDILMWFTGEFPRDMRHSSSTGSYARLLLCRVRFVKYFCWCTYFDMSQSDCQKM